MPFPLQTRSGAQQAQIDAMVTDIADVNATVASIVATRTAVCRYDAVGAAWPARPTCVLCIYEGPTAQRANITDDLAQDMFVSSDGA